MRTIMKLLLSIMFILGLGLATSGTAYADPPSANKPTSQGELGQCAPAAENNRIVPEQRWRDSIPHLITSSEGTGWFGGNFNIGSMMQSGSTTQILDWGSFLWGTAIDLTEASQRFCILYRVGGSLDRAAAAIGNILFGGALTGTPFEGLPIGVLVLLFIIGVNLVKSLKGQAVWREVLRCAAALALMIIMVGIPGTGIGAVNSTGAGAGGESVGLNTPDNYVPAPLSPGWFITQINNVVASVVAMPTEQMNNMTTSIQSSLLFGDEAGSPLGCVHYVATLEDIYGVYAGEKNLPDASVSVTLAASKLWEVSAVNAWRKIQFDGAALGDKVWCRVLDGWRSFDNDGWAPPALTQLQSLRDQGFQFRTVSPNSLAFIKTGSGSGGTTTGSERNRAAQAVAWAACEWTGDGNSPLDGAWKWSNSYLVPAAAVNNNEAEAKCDGLFTAEDWTADGWLPKSLSNKDIDAYLDEPRDGVSDGKMKSEARAFLISLRGDGWDGMAASVSFLISGLCALVAFGLLALAVIVGKVFALVFMLTFFFQVIVGMFKQDALGGIWKQAKAYVGMSFFTAAAGLIFGLITTLSLILVVVAGALTGGQDSPVAILMTGLAPALGCAMVVWLTKQMGLPNPLSVTGALAYGKAAEGVAGSGGRAGYGMGRRLLNRARYSAESKALRAARGLLPGGPGHGTGGKTARDKISEQDREDQERLMAEMNAEKNAEKVNLKTGMDPDFEKEAPLGQSDDVVSDESELDAPMLLDENGNPLRNEDGQGVTVGEDGKRFDDPTSQAAQKWLHDRASEDDPFGWDPTRGEHDAKIDQAGRDAFRDRMFAPLKGNLAFDFATAAKGGRALVLKDRFHRGVQRRFGSVGAVKHTVGKTIGLSVLGAATGGLGVAAYAGWKGAKKANQARKALSPTRGLQHLWDSHQAGQAAKTAQAADLWRAEVSRRQTLHQKRMGSQQHEPHQEQPVVVTPVVAPKHSEPTPSGIPQQMVEQPPVYSDLGMDTPATPSGRQVEEPDWGSYGDERYQDEVEEARRNPRE